MILRLYAQHDHALEQWKETLKEVERLGKGFWEVGEFERIPGVSDPDGAGELHTFTLIKNLIDWLEDLCATSVMTKNAHERSK